MSEITYLELNKGNLIDSNILTPIYIRLLGLA